MKIEDIKVGRWYWYSVDDGIHQRKVVSMSDKYVVTRACHASEWATWAEGIDTFLQNVLSEVPRRWYQFWRWFE